MIEIEKKYAISNLQDMEKNLIDLGFEKEATFTQIDIPISQVYQTLINSWPRVRYLPEKNKTIITVKGKVFSEELGVVRSETEIETTDFEKSIQLFKSLGFFEMGKVEKKRTIFLRENVEISIDQVIDFGNFIEIEVKTRDEKEGLSKIEELSQKLDLKNEIRGGYFDLINEKICADFRLLVKSLEENQKAAKPHSKYLVLNDNIIKVYSEKGAYYAGFPGKKIIQDANFLKLI